MAWTLCVDVGLVLTGSISAQDKMAIRTCCANLLLASNVVYRFGYTPDPFVGGEQDTTSAESENSQGGSLPRRSGAPTAPRVPKPLD